MSELPFMEIYDKVRTVPPDAKKQILGGRLKGFTDINPMWRIKTMTETFGACGEGWTYNIESINFRDGSNGEVACFVTITLRYKRNGAWSEPVYGVGGSMFVSNESKGLYTDDEAVKKALTDAIGVACKALGVGASVYWDKDSGKYTSEQAQASKPKSQSREVQDAKSEILTITKGLGVSVETAKKAGALVKAIGADILLFWRKCNDRMLDDEGVLEFAKDYQNVLDEELRLMDEVQ